MEESQVDPPFQQAYKNLFDNLNETSPGPKIISRDYEFFTLEEFELPLIDLEQLNRGEFEKEKCKRDIAEASKEWGFFQVVNHGISREILEKMRSEQIKVFRRPFHEKMDDEKGGSKSLAGSYRWGTPSATCLKQLAWSEAYHVPLNVISGSDGGHDNLR